MQAKASTLGVIDGMKSKGEDTEPYVEARKVLLRRFDYQLG